MNPEPSNLKRAFTLLAAILIGMAFCVSSPTRAAAPRAPSFTAALQDWNDGLDTDLFDFYQTADITPANPIVPPTALVNSWSPDARALFDELPASTPLPYKIGHLRARMQQALLLQMATAVRNGDVLAAQTYRAELLLPRGVSASEGELVLQNLQGTKKDEASRLLVREAITWQTTRVRQLLDECTRSTQHDTAMPGRLAERLGEALTLADLPPSVQHEAGIDSLKTLAPETRSSLLAAIQKTAWDKVEAPLTQLRDATEGVLPSLLTDKEKERRERLLLKLVTLIPKEYGSGVRDGKVTVPLEYREAVAFHQQARQLVGELAPLWLSGKNAKSGDDVRALDDILTKADTQISTKVDPDTLQTTLNGAADLLTSKFGITLHRNGTTADIVDEVMLETRSSLASSLAAALQGQWSEAERLRVEAYTTYDPDLEARLLPRDPELATNIERLLLDGIDHPGVKMLIDRHETGQELSDAYERVYVAFDKATAILKSDVSPGAAIFSSSSIVIREGLEGLLVIIAILAGLRGDENARSRRLFWLGVLGSVVFTLITWGLSQTVMKSLRNYGEVIEAVTGMLAVVILLLITNWLFQQVYWRQWVTSLKAQTVQGSNAWSLLTAGFLVGYREGFETVLFLQNLYLDAGGKSVGLGVLIGVTVLFAIGFAAIRLGLKLPYFQIMMVTAGMIGLVLITFVGTTVRAAQTIGWAPVHRLTSSSWPIWLGNWFGVNNTWESVGTQIGTCVIVLGTWRIARWKAKRKAEARGRVIAAERAAKLKITQAPEVRSGPAVSPHATLSLTQVHSAPAGGAPAENAHVCEVATSAETLACDCNLDCPTAPHEAAPASRINEPTTN